MCLANMSSLKQRKAALLARFSKNALANPQIQEVAMSQQLECGHMYRVDIIYGYIY